MKVIEHNAAPKVILKHSAIELYVRPDTRREKRRVVLDEWYRQKLKEIVPEYISDWKKKMKTKWGTCNREAKRIWLNLKLAKKPRECIEYIIVHEMVHLIERHHNERFIAYMDKYLPKWRFCKEELNKRPLRYENGVINHNEKPRPI